MATLYESDQIITYSAKFNTKIYNKFNLKAAQEGRLLNEFLNVKIKELKYNFEIKRFKENEDYKHKKVFLKIDNHKTVKNAFYIYDVTMRDYIQSLMVKVIKE